MKEAATIRFKEIETSEDGVAIVRYDNTSVAICLSIKAYNDLEVVMSKEDGRALFEALKIAIE